MTLHCAPRRLRCGDHEIELGRRTLVMGIVNVTPDSFYAGSRASGVDHAVEVATRMAAEGADLIDVGGESTRPGSDPVEPEEELARVVPVVGALARSLRVPISIDTWRARTARAALDAGAGMVNDVSALRFDPEMAEVVRAAGVPVVLMHMKGRPKAMQSEARYDDVVAEIAARFEEWMRGAQARGIPREGLILDPGIGFAKTAGHSLEVLRRLRELRVLGAPLLLGPSRKSFIGNILGLPPEERLEGTAAAVALGIANGADMVRVHDVKEMVRVARVADAIVRRPGADPAGGETPS